MASHKVNKLANDSEHLASACEELSACGPPEQTDEELQSELHTIPKPQTPGKFRRTALRFFGVRKNICILPSIFGGRNKWSSKKGISKSKTHDGLSKASQDDNLDGVVTAGNFEYHSQKEPSTKFHSEFNQPADQKSLSLNRQKKGLRSLFHSLKNHKHHRNVELEKNEMIAMSSHLCNKEVPVVQDNMNQYVTECLDSLSELTVPDFTNAACGANIAPECIDVDVTLENTTVRQGSFKSLLEDQMLVDQMKGMNMMAEVSNKPEGRRARSDSCPSLQMTPEPKLKVQQPIGSSDQLNLIFGEVASLKSFDSLTGCGDIIADQDDDSIAESTISGERSRNAGKRASCFLTYQGGGEEMASPDDFEGESLPDLWGNTAAEEMCYTFNKDRSASLTEELSDSHLLDLMNSNSVLQAGATDTSSMADVLTPQSEHQESVPNSDEGYYDSTTPGPDEEGQEKVDRIRTDRLPRDSYSGDALYELFAPDDSLISPCYENQSKLPNPEPCKYLGEPVDGKASDFVPKTHHLQMRGAELYKVQDFLSAEMYTIGKQSKEMPPYSRGLQENNSNETVDLNSAHQASINKNAIKPEVFDAERNMPAPVEKASRAINAECEKRHGNLSLSSASDLHFDPFSSETFCERKEHQEENQPVSLPYRNTDASKTSSDLDYGQTVCFSQALVDYTKHTQLLSSSPSGMDGLDTHSSFAQNMQALPPIVTFDVVDMHNEGEYDEQLQMEMEEDITSPYQQFEESYLQKDAFADYQMLDLYEQSLFSNTWAIASLPRHLSLTRVNQSMPSPLCLDKRSRSLDTESLDLKIADKYRGSSAAIVACPETEKVSKRESSQHHRNNGHMLTSDLRDDNSMFLSWQTETARTLSPSKTDGKIAEQMHSLSQTQIKRTILSGSSCDFISQATELCKRQCHLPLQADPCLPHNSLVYSDIMGEDMLVTAVSTSDVGDEDTFYSAAMNSQSYSQYGKNRPVAVAQGMSQLAAVNRGASEEEIDFISEARKPMDMVRPLACSK